MLREFRRRPRQGVIMILFTMMMLFVVLPAVGLAIDSGVMFVVKGRMQSAVDGAALAAARSLSRGTNFSDQQDAATVTAKKIYHMNMEKGWMGVVAADPTVTFPAGSAQAMSILVEAVVDAPTYFMRIVGVNSVTLKSKASTTRRFVNIMMVIDRSGSLGPACAQLRSAATQFVQTFVSGRDKLGLETFGTSYRTDFPAGTTFRAAGGGSDVETLIGNIQCVGGTNAAAAYWQAYQQLVALNEPGALNAMLFFTDGLPNTIHMPSLEIKSTSSCSDKTTPRNGVVAATTAGTRPAGIFLAVQPLPPGAGISPDMTFIPNSTGCYYSSYYYADTDLVALTRTGQPEVDVNGISITGWKPVSRDSSGRISVSNSNATNAGINALVNAASNARNNTALNVVTFAIGLGTDVDDDVLNRVANVPGTTYYDTAQPAGRYVHAANGTELQSAFSQLASEVLRISQ